MDNNLDAKTRLNPYNPPHQIKQERNRDKLPPSPVETPRNHIPRTTPRTATPPTSSYPTTQGAMDTTMPGMAGRNGGYSSTGYPTTGYPATGMQGMGYPAQSAPMAGLPTGMPGMGYHAPSGPMAGPPAGMPGMGSLTTGAPAGFQGAQVMPGMPTGMPAGGATGLAPLTPFNQPIPVTTESTLYINGFLRTMIGRKVTVEFLIGTNTFTDRTGTLLAVGANYIVINEVETDDILICDFFSIKFVKVYY